jgi:formiminotetrahydrofolate cyclodeaminase
MDQSTRPYADRTLGEFSRLLASPEPVPGGGSTSAIVGAFGASLLAMVASLSEGRPKYERYAATIGRSRDVGERARRRLLELADEDARAYAAFMDGRRLPADSDDERAVRDAAVQEAAKAATRVPLEIIRQCVELAVRIEALAGRSNLSAASDLGVAGLLVEAAASGAGANVLVNVPMITDARFAGGATAELEGYLDSIQHLTRRTREIVGENRLREPEEA